MQKYSIIKSERVKRGIKHTLEGEEVVYWDLRAGLSWEPLAAVVGGEERGELVYAPIGKRGTLRVTAELEGSSQDLAEFFERLFDVILLQKIDTLYADLTAESFYEVFLDWMHRKGFRTSLAPAPYADNPAAQISLIRSWDRDGLLRIDKGFELYGVLENLVDGELPGSVRALGNLVSGYMKYPPVRGSHHYLPDRDEGSRFGWMGH